MRDTSLLTLGMLVSGRGSNMEAIIDSIERRYLPANVVVVISNRKDAPALKKAEKHGIASIFADPKGKSREEYDALLVNILNQHEVQLVILAGYMKIVTPVLLSTFPNKIMNIHPALLPSFPGTDAQAQALHHGVKITGCTVHFVDDGCDTGPIILQAAVAVKDDDTVGTLSQRILKEEHRIYTECIKAYAEGRLETEESHVRWRASTSC